jgi:SAM-dependent methyltransferase
LPSSDAAAVFGEIYSSGFWGGSGGGSNPEHLAEYIALVDRLILEYKPSSVLDVGCGLGWTAERINWRDSVYVGVDVVPSVVEAAKLMQWGLFYACDAITEKLPPADFVILKEVTQHLDEVSIRKLLQNLSGYKRVLHVSVTPTGPYGRKMFVDIEMGQTRGVDLMEPPFSLACEHLLTYKLGETEYLCQLWTPGSQNWRDIIERAPLPCSDCLFATGG